MEIQLNNPAKEFGLVVLSFVGCVLTLSACAHPTRELPFVSDVPKTSTLGYLENVRVGKQGFTVAAKLDTGADTSSVYAHKTEIYLRNDNESWVRFNLVNVDGTVVEYDEKVTRFTKIKNKTGGTIRRPVVILPICIAGIWVDAEVNLANRSNFKYQTLIGRERLSYNIIVDSSKKFVSTLVCHSQSRNDE